MFGSDVLLTEPPTVLLTVTVKFGKVTGTRIVWVAWLLKESWQVKVKLVLVTRLLSTCEPDVGSDPLQPPLAVQDTVPVDDQVSVVEPPDATGIGFALRVTVGRPDIVVEYCVQPEFSPLVF
jgi:hypothetical protein